MKAKCKQNKQAGQDKEDKKSVNGTSHEAIRKELPERANRGKR